MKRSLFLTLPFLYAAPASAQSAVPGAISYQGRVADANGVLIGDAAPVNRKVTLRIYDAATATTPLYAEEQTVTINKGVFSVLVGTGLEVRSEPHPAVATVFNGAERFLGVTVDDGGPAADPEIAPRQQIVSTAYAFTARSAETAGSVQQASGTSNMNVLNANNFTVNGHSKITGTNLLEFGIGRTKNTTAGAIGYQAFSSGLDILGAGENIQDRRLTLWAEAGTEFKGPINFGERNGQHVNLWGTTNGIGVQINTLYNRSSGNFAWYVGGSHSDNTLDAGGGISLAHLGNSGLSVHRGNISVPNGTFQGRLDRGGHGVFASSYGDGHSFGSQEWTTFSRTSRSFAWYMNGIFDDREINNGGGTTLAILNNDGLLVGGNSIRIGNNTGGQEAAAGTISYRKLTADSLDIVGAGTDGSNRKIKLWAEGGLAVNGSLTASGSLDAGGSIHANGEIGTAGNVVCGSVFFLGNNWTSRTGSDYEFYKDNNRRGYIRGDNGQYVSTSDRRLKKDIVPLTGMLDTAMKLKPASFHYKSSEAKAPLTYGFIAQEVREVMPDLVDEKDGVLGLTMDGIIPVTIGAIQEQQRMLEAKDAEIAALKRELAAAQESNALQDTRLASIEKALKLESPSAPAKKETKVASRR